MTKYIGDRKGQKIESSLAITEFWECGLKMFF